MPDIEHLDPSELKPWPRNARSHSPKQLRQLADSIRRFGFTQPVLIDEDNRILAGHGRVRAAAQVGLVHVPCLKIAHLSEAEKRAYVLADNKLALNAGWDRALLTEELKDLLTEDTVIDIGVTGFSLAEANKLMPSDASTALTLCDEGLASSSEDICDDAPPRCKPGDIFELGAHWLICGDSLSRRTVDKFLYQEAPRMIVTVHDDPEHPPVDMDEAFSGSTLIAADEFGLSVIIADSDPAHCDRIIRRWETHAQGDAILFDNEFQDDQFVDEGTTEGTAA